MTGLIDKEQRVSPTGRAALSTTREFWFAAGALTILYILLVSIGSRRYVWFDELFTFDIANSPSLGELWRREVQFDMQPPAGYVLSRASMHIFGSTPFGLRFPSMVEFYAGSVAMLLYVRRKAGLAFATLAVLLIWGQHRVVLRRRSQALCTYLFFLLLPIVVVGYRDPEQTPAPGPSRRGDGNFLFGDSARFFCLYVVCLCRRRSSALLETTQSRLCAVGGALPAHAGDGHLCAPHASVCGRRLCDACISANDFFVLS